MLTDRQIADNKLTQTIPVTCDPDGRLKRMPLASLTPFQGDLKDLSAKNHDKLKRSLLAEGFMAPVFVWGEKILDGHQRTAVLVKEGWTLDGDGGVPVVEIVADTAQEAARKLLKLTSAYGKPDANGVFEFALAHDLLLDDFADVDLPDFDVSELEDLFDAADPQPEPAEPPEPPVNPAARAGDVWHLGNHRVLCGDSTDADNVVALLGGELAHMVFMDPPYNVAYGDSNNPRYTAHRDGKHKLIENDNLKKEEWIAFNVKLAAILKEHCGGDLYIWGAPGPDGMRQRLTMIDEGMHWSATIIWKKNRLVLAQGKFQRLYEPCFYGWPDGRKSSFVGDRKNVELWEHDRPSKSELHPTMKPIDLCVHGIELSSNVGDTVMDLFLGSGSTLIACETVGRHCRGMELDPAYVDVIVTRWEEYTNQEAILDGDGRTFSEVRSERLSSEDAAPVETEAAG